MTDTPRKLGLARNTSNYGDRDFALYLRKTFAKSMGYSQAMLDKPVVGIADTASDYNNCHRTIPELVEAVKRGVLAAGGLPLAFPTISICEPSPQFDDGVCDSDAGEPAKRFASTAGP